MRITPRDRSAYRSATPPPAAGHLVALSGRWALWRSVCVRGAGFPFDTLDALASPALAAAADGESTVEYEAEYARAARQLTRAVHALATDPRFREAIAWQNRRALESGIDALLRHDPDSAPRTARNRRNEALVTSYAQRYAAKNDTIGFFGPAGWAEIVDGAPALTVRTAAGLAARTVYFEGWAVRTLAERYAAGVRPWLVPRRAPLVGLGDTYLRVPFAPPVPIAPLYAYTLRMVDGARTARGVVAAVLAEPAANARDAAEVYAVLTELHEQGRIAWTLDVPPDDIRPEWTVQSRLSTVDDEAARAPALAALDELVAARDAVADAAGVPGAVAPALAALDETFTRLTGAEPTRLPGEVYAGRTLVYEECLRGEEITLGPSLLDPVRSPLALMLEAARWFTAAGAALVHRACLDLYRSHGDEPMPLGEFWLGANKLIFDMPAGLVGPLVRALQERWARILPLPAGARRVTVHSGDIEAAVLGAFATARPGWAGAVHHSPDVMLCATGPDAIRRGDVEWVLGELHPGRNTLRYATRVAYHRDPDALRAASAADIGRPIVLLAETAELGGMPARLGNALAGPDDLRLVFAHDSSGLDPARTLLVGDCDLVEVNGRLVVRSGARVLDLVEVLADALSGQLIQHFHPFPRGRRTPRVSIDRLIVQRESWGFTPEEVPFARMTGEAARFRAARRWARTHDLPRYVFVRATGERKPVFVDLYSLASVDLLCRLVRRADRHPEPTVTVTEMLPTPEQLWLADGSGRRYTTELRLCAVEQT